ncbi:Zinc-finger associated domain (zf-AD) [Popillia japonica]|uniref:Zinc-finger associated domain (Zf-AD) n=1 Tax=Popillia japonica TaxID=7064 RepID=A0AAW1KH51_POPJA
MNTLFNTSEYCRACLRTECLLNPTSTIDTDNIKLGEKLNSCVSEICWLKEDFIQLICSNCIDKLRIAYDFRILCLQSDNTLQQYLNEPKDITNVPTYADITNFELANNIVTLDTNTLRTDKPLESSTSELLNLKHFLDGTVHITKPAMVTSDSHNSRSAALDLDSVATVGFVKNNKIIKRIILSTKSVKTQTQPLPQYPSLTPAAARLESVKNKPTIVIDDPYKYSCQACGKKILSHILYVHISYSQYHL